MTPAHPDCTDCKTSSRLVCANHVDMDATDLELAELKESYWEIKAALSSVSGALYDSGDVVPEDDIKFGEAVRKIVADRARLKEENRGLRARVEWLEVVRGALVDALERSNRYENPEGEDSCAICGCALLGLHGYDCFVGAALGKAKGETH